MVRKTFSICLPFLFILLNSCQTLQPLPEEETGTETEATIQEVRKAWLKGDIRGTFNKAKYVVEHGESEENRGEAWLRIAQVQKLYDRPEHVLKAARKGLSLSTTPEIRAALYQVQGQVHKEQGRRKKALESYKNVQQVVQKEPDADRWIDYPNLLLETGQLQIRTGKFEEGKATWYQVFEQYPDSPVVAKVNKKLAFYQPYFSVQPGAFLKRSNAINLQKKLQNVGFDPQIQQVEIEGDLFHCVRIGRFSSFQKARNKAKELKPHVDDYYIIP